MPDSSHREQSTTSATKLAIEPLRPRPRSIQLPHDFIDPMAQCVDVLTVASIAEMSVAEDLRQLIAAIDDVLEYHAALGSRVDGMETWYTRSQWSDGRERIVFESMANVLQPALASIHDASCVMRVYKRIALRALGKDTQQPDLERRYKLKLQSMNDA